MINQIKIKQYQEIDFVNGSAKIRLTRDERGSQVTIMSGQNVGLVKELILEAQEYAGIKTVGKRYMDSLQEIN